MALCSVVLCSLQVTDLLHSAHHYHITRAGSPAVGVMALPVLSAKVMAGCQISAAASCLASQLSQGAPEALSSSHTLRARPQCCQSRALQPSRGMRYSRAAQLAQSSSVDSSRTVRLGFALTACFPLLGADEGGEAAAAFFALELPWLPLPALRLAALLGDAGEAACCSACCSAAAPHTGL